MPEDQNSPPRFFQLIDFSRPENRMAGLLTLYYLLVMTSFTALKPARNALLLDLLGPAWLPVAIIGTAVVTGFVVYVAGLMADIYPGRSPTTMTTLLLLTLLLLFRQLFETSGRWVALPFYIFVQLFSNILITQFWLVAGGQFTAREAKRLFGLVGAGATIGGTLGPIIAFRLVDRIGTVNLLYVSAGVLVLVLPLVLRLERQVAQRQEPEREEKVDGSALSLMRELRHVKLIGIIMGASFIAQTILDYQFQTVANDAFGSADEKTAFFAKFFAVQNLLGMFIQVAVTRFMLLRFGVGISLFLLPFALATGAVGVLVYPTLWVVGLAKFSEGGIRYSIWEATREVLYLPLPSQVRSRVRPLIDMFGSRLFDGLGGLLILFCTVVIQLPMRALSIFSLVIIGGWIFAVLAVKREYLETLRSFFKDASTEPQDRAAEVLADQTVDLLLDQLKSPDEAQACNALAMLDLMHDKSSVLPHLSAVVREHPSEVVRAEALNMLAQAQAGDCVREAEAMLESAVADVRVAAVRYLCLYGRPDVGLKLNALLNDEDHRVRIAAIGSIHQAEGFKKDEVRASLEEMCSGGGEGSEAAMAEVALLLGTINDPDYDGLMIRLLRHESPVVLRAAMEGAARTSRRIFVPLIVPHLADGGMMLFAQRALRDYGDRIVYTLQDYMDDPDESEEIRRSIPGCYAAIGSQKAADALLDLLKDYQAELGDVILESLGEIHTRGGELGIDEQKVEEALLREVEQGVPEQPEDRDHRLWVTLKLLEFVYPAADVRRAYAGLTSGEKDAIANAVELLDTLMRVEHKRALVPFIEKCVRQV